MVSLYARAVNMVHAAAPFVGVLHARLPRAAAQLEARMASILLLVHEKVYASRRGQRARWRAALAAATQLGAEVEACVVEGELYEFPSAFEDAVETLRTALVARLLR